VSSHAPTQTAGEGGGHRLKPVTLTTGQALVRFMKAQFSERDGRQQRAIDGIWGIFGHGNAPGLGQAIVQEGEGLPLYQPKNEQAAVHVAIGHAKATRRLSTFACTASIGPGATNMLTGAATATANRLPVLLLPADTFASRRPGSVLQQLEYPGGDITLNDAFRPVTRFFDRVTRPDQLFDALLQAMRVLFDPAETGAVAVAISQDVLGEAYAFPGALFQPRIWHVGRRSASVEEIDRAATAIAAAERPLLIAGGGVRHSAAEEQLAAFVKQLGIPVAETSAGKGSLAPCDLLAGGIGVNGTRAANELAKRADVVICVGTRLTDFTTGSRSLFEAGNVRFVAINVNSADAHKHSATAVVADAREALAQLGNALDGHRGTSSAYRDEIRDRWAKWATALEVDTQPVSDAERVGQGEVLQILADAVQPGDWVVAAAGYQPGDLLKLWSVPDGAFAHIEFGFSCMGHEIPAGLGIRLAGATGEVFVVIGDGTYLMSPTELVTATQEQLKLTVVLLDNGGYQSINHLALASTNVSAGNEFRQRAGGRLPDGPPVLVDYVANASSMGTDAVKAISRDALRETLQQARDSTNTTVIVCPTDPDRPLLSSGAFWDLGVPDVSDSPVTEQLTAAHKAARSTQRTF
jgi:3D-(3,5/4)-trihydroxycyclohexane-1,2-dione acylhydrolase (decyclizing)